MPDEQRAPSTIEQIIDDALKAMGGKGVRERADMSQGDLWREFLGTSLMYGPMAIGPRGMQSMSNLVGMTEPPSPAITGGRNSELMTYGPNSAEDLAYSHFLRRPVVPNANQFYGPVEFPANTNRQPLGPPRLRVIEQEPPRGY